MLKNKKGLSEVVMTVIMIVLILVAVGIIWTVVQNILNKSSTEIDYMSKCLGLNIQPTVLLCNHNLDSRMCIIRVSREAGSGNPIGGVEITLSSAIITGDPVYKEGNIAVSNEFGNINETEVGIPLSQNANKVSVRIFFVDSKTNEKYFCPGITTYTKE